MVGWPYRLNGHKFEQTPGEGEGQGSLACFSPWGRKEEGTTNQLNDDQRERKRVTSLGMVSGGTIEPGKG